MSKKIFNVIVLLVLLIPTNLLAQVTLFDIHTVGDNYKINYQETPPLLESIVPFTSGYDAVRWESSNMPLSGFTLATGNNTSLSYNIGSALQSTTFFKRIITINFIEYTSNTIKLEVVSLNNENMNYIREHNVLIPNQTQWTTIDQLTIGNKLQTTTYLDNLGRPLQKVAKGVATPNLPATEPWGDVVQFSIYDELSRKPKNYLPYTTLANPGKFKTNTIADQALYYTNNYNETAPYSKVTYDNSPLNIAQKVNAPGTSWEASAGNMANFQPNSTPNYFTTDLVPIYRIGYAETDQPIFSGVYNAAQLIVTTGIDENGKKVMEYINKSGQVILKKVQLDDAPAGFYNGWICTFNIYDDFGQLRLQAQPEAVKWFITHNMSFDGAFDVIKDLCFVYMYDIIGRNTYKKAPGAKPLYMVYGKFTSNYGVPNTYNSASPTGSLAFTQDGNQRAKPTPEWTYYQYDFLNRPLKTSIYSSNRTRQNIINSPGVPTSEYNSLTFVKETYYDDYTYPNAKPFDTNFDNAQAGSTAPEPIATTKRTLEMPTGSKVRVLGTNTFLINTIYYDERGRAIQTLEDNIKQGTDVTTMQYDYSSKLLNTAQKHTAVGTAYINYSTITKYAFDKLGRVTDIYKKFGTNAFKHIGNYAFDDVGRLKRKRLDPGYTGTGKTEIETLNYTYNIHNSITGINKAYALKEVGLNKWDYFFGMYLGYDNRDGLFASAQLDGHVTGILWTTQGDNEQRKYDYGYDNAGRLIAAAFKQKKGTNWTNSELDFSVSGQNGKIQYDLNGNLLAMLQKGVVVGNTTPVNIDDLSYNYAPNSNKLLSVTDASTAGPANGKLADFKDGSNVSDDYVYDDNGNLIIDLNKNVTSTTGGAGITYNYLDKPEQIRLAGKGTITIQYDADGSKLQKTYTPENTAIPATTTTYINGFVYKGTALQYINFEEGRLRMVQTVNTNNNYDYLQIDGTETMPTISGQTPPVGGKGTFDFFIRDYQSNVRMVLTEETHVGSNICTMETERAANEEPIFGKTDANGNPVAGNEVQARFPVTNMPNYNTIYGWSEPIGNYVAKLYKGRRTATGTDMGPGSLLKVMAGDKLSATTIYYYANPVTNTTGNTSSINSILSSLTAAISSSTAASGVVHEAAGNITSNLSSNVPFTNITSPDNGNPNGTNPKAYLTMLFFDERFNFVPEASSSVRVQGDGNGQDPLVIDNVKAPKNGYAYIYISNENTEPVYFDNLRVVHERGRITEENHYYAYGLKIAGISSRKLGDANEGALKNQYQYQGDYSEFDDETQWNEFELRNYDSQIGRFVQADPYDQFPSPYTGMGNDPISNVDPSGGFSLAGITGTSNLLFNTAVTTIGGALVGGIVGMATGNDNGWKIGAGIGLGVGLASGINWGGVGNISGMSIASMGVQALNFGVNAAQANNQNFTLKELITYGQGSARFTSLLKQAGINDNNYSSQISFGSGTKTESTAPYKITLNKTSLQETTLGLAHELTNRINGVALAKFTTDVGAGTITSTQYADRVLGVEAKGVMNQIIVGSQLNMQPSVAGNQPYYELYKSGGTTEAALIKSINKNIRKINLANGGGNAYNFYRKEGAAYRKAMKAYEKQMEEYNKKYKKN